MLETINEKSFEISTPDKGFSHQGNNDNFSLQVASPQSPTHQDKFSPLKRYSIFAKNLKHDSKENVLEQFDRLQNEAKGNKIIYK